MPPGRRSELRQILPYTPIQPTELTCTCTTYAGKGVECIYHQLLRVFPPSPIQSPRTPKIPALLRRKNFKTPNPVQGRMI